MAIENKRRKVELLSPVGDKESLLAAVTNGTDAVYLGTREFNARINAKNFSIEELGWVVSYCHEHGVRVYLTMNTLVKNDEIRKFFSVMSLAYAVGIDGTIIQHHSFLDIIKRNYPGLAVFISTQGAVGNLAGALLLRAADRIILARELPLDEVRKITNAGVHTEVFVHGALCFSYSGLCLFSSFVAGRSGNRGGCAQQCRQRYGGGYPFSMKELCLVRRLPELIEAGVTGFKIEGRMRSPLYVAVATRLYRKAIDSYLAGNFTLPEKEMAEMEVVFSREFTEGFIFGEKDLTSPERPMNRGAYLGAIEDGEIVLERPVEVGSGVGIWGENSITGGVIHRISVDSRDVVSAGVGERVKLDLGAKDGAKIYVTSSPSIKIQPDFKVERTLIVMAQRKPVKAVLTEIVPVKSPSKVNMMVKAYSLKEAEEASDAGAGTIFYDIFAPDFPEPGTWKRKATLGAYLPRIMDDAELTAAVELIKQKKPYAILSGNMGFLKRRSEFKMPVFLDYTSNAFNDIDLTYFGKFGAMPVLSPELTLNEMTKFQNKDAVILVHGDIVLVNTKVELNEKDYTDEKGERFPVRKEGSYWQLLNCHPYGIFNDIRTLKEAGFTQFYIDKQGRGAHFVEIYLAMLDHEVPDRRLRKGYTSGHLYRPVE